MDVRSHRGPTGYSPAPWKHASRTPPQGRPLRQCDQDCLTIPAAASWAWAWPRPTTPGRRGRGTLRTRGATATPRTGWLVLISRHSSAYTYSSHEYVSWAD